MPEVRIQAELRTEFGKGAARRTRRAGRVPAVIYGHGAETRHLSLPEHELMLALKTQNALLRLEGLGTPELALPKAIQRDSLKGIWLYLLEPHSMMTLAIARANPVRFA